MACTITISEVQGVNPDVNGNPALIRVSGTTTGNCPQVLVKMQIPGALFALAQVENGAFTAELELGSHYDAGQITCGQTQEQTFYAECLGGDSCADEYVVTDLACVSTDDCTIAFAATNPVLIVTDTVETDKPASITISGTLGECAGGVEVQIKYTAGIDNPAQSLWKSATVNGNIWSVTLYRNTDYDKDLSCNATINVTARCADDHSCAAEANFIIDCGGDIVIDCPAVVLHMNVTDDCEQGRRKVVFTVQLSGVTANTLVAGSIRTGDLSLVNEVEIPVEYSPASAANWTDTGAGVVTREYIHFYPEGVFNNVRLSLTGACEGDTPLTSVTNLVIPALTVPTCDCEDVTLKLVVCHVTNPALDCDDDIPGVDCDRLEESEVTAPNGIRPGIYLVRAFTDPPNSASSFSWTVNGELQQSEADYTLCVEVGAGETLEVNVAAFITPNCIPSADVTLRGRVLTTPENEEPSDEDGVPPGEEPPADVVPPTEDEDDGDSGQIPPIDTPEGCTFNICILALWGCVLLSILAGIAIIITACILSAEPTATFLAGVAVSFVLAVAGFVAFLLWSYFCASPFFCQLLVLIWDILRFLAIVTGIIGIIVALAGDPPCGIGLLIDFAYFYLLAEFVLAILHALNCPITGQGILGGIAQQIMGYLPANMRNRMRG